MKDMYIEYNITNENLVVYSMFLSINRFFYNIFYTIELMINVILLV